MNFIQRTPNDPRHGEFHDGEYEYWPVEISLKSRRISFPAGLALLAAVAASALLYVALTVLYVLSAPLSITEDSALINANVYNNRSGTLVYTLTTEADSFTVLQDGILEENETTLHFQNLTGGTTYLLRYYDSALEEAGRFLFTTPGEGREQEKPEISEPSTEPGTEPAEETTEPAEETTEPAEETMEPAEETTEPAEETTEPVEETTKPTDPGYYPPVIIPPDTKPTEPPVDPIEPTVPEEPTAPSTTPTEPEKPETPPITALEPDVGEIQYMAPDDSGDEIEAYFRYEEYHIFQNVPGGDYSIQIRQGDTPITEYTQEYTEDGTLRVSFTGGLVPVGQSATTTVTVTSGTETITSTCTVFPPSLESAEVAVTKNSDGSYTFTVTANVLSDGTEEMECEAFLYLSIDDYTGMTLTLVPESSGCYTASYTANIITEHPLEEAYLIVTGYWSRIGEGVYSQSRTHSYNYIP